MLYSSCKSVGAPSAHNGYNERFTSPVDQLEHFRVQLRLETLGLRFAGAAPPGPGRLTVGLPQRKLEGGELLAARDGSTGCIWWAGQGAWVVALTEGLRRGCTRK